MANKVNEDISFLLITKNIIKNIFLSNSKHSKLIHKSFNTFAQLTMWRIVHAKNKPVTLIFIVKIRVRPVQHSYPLELLCYIFYLKLHLILYAISLCLNLFYLFLIREAIDDYVFQLTIKKVF